MPEQIKVAKLDCH